MSEGVEEGAPSALARGAVRGTLWLTTANYVGFAASILVNLAIMRILDLPAVGAFALAFAVSEFVGLVGAFSLELALIHFKDEATGTDYDTAYILALLLGAAAVAISVVLYPILGLMPAYTQEVRIFVLILGFARPLAFVSMVASAQIEMEFRYRALSVGMLVVMTTSGLAALGLAALGAGALSLVVREVAIALLGYLVYGLASRRRCRWRWSRRSAARLLRYSNLMFVNRVLEVALARFDRIAIGTKIGKVDLGAYHNGRYLAEMGYSFAQPISRLSFNVYSRVKADPARLERAYRLVNFFLIRGAALIGIVLGFLARDVILVTYGPKWLPAVPTARILAPYAAMLPIFSNLIVMLYGRGMMRESVIVRAVQVAIFVPGVLVLTAVGGASAAGWALLAATIVGVALVVFYQRGIVSFSGRELFLAPALASIVAGLAAIFVAPAVGGEGFASSLLRLVLVSTLYAAALLLIDRRAIADHYRYLRAFMV